MSNGVGAKQPVTWDSEVNHHMALLSIWQSCSASLRAIRQALCFCAAEVHQSLDYRAKIISLTLD